MEDYQEAAKRLESVYAYAFYELVPYEFFRPKEGRDVEVNLAGKELHCKDCGRVEKVAYRNAGTVYYSHGKLKEEQAAYEVLGLDFPSEEELAAGAPFTNEALGYCEDCARKRARKEERPEQLFVLLAENLHRVDKLAFAAQRAGDTAGLAACRESAEHFLEDAQKLLDFLPEKFSAYVGRPLSLPESMADKIYHEYTVAFPAEGTSTARFYLCREIEKSRAAMFLSEGRPYIDA